MIMKKYMLLSATLLTGLLFSCGGNDTETTKSTSEKCTYSVVNENSTLEWTAFKFTERKGVTGTFREINIDGLESSEDPKTLIESLSFSIPTATVETENTERNGKISKQFFGTISTENITGEVKSLGKNGKAVISIKMNGVSKDVTGEYTLNAGTFVFKAAIDVVDWNAGSGIAALNAICKDLHTGTDGVSKLWSEVDLSFTTVLKKECK
jgi:polyisoprenoid-binding protein YceI